MTDYISTMGGYILNELATENCQFCSIRSTNVFLSSVSSSYANRYRNFGILWAFIVFNACAALFFYWLLRVPKKKKEAKVKKE